MSLVVVVLALALSSCVKTERDRFIERCKQQINYQLRSPSQAVYGSIHAAPPAATTSALDRHGYFKGNRITIWAATVDAPNAFGTMVRNYVICDETPEHGLVATVQSDLSLYGVPAP